jgi:pSer/pThr/pTyr-binding forkhead associated (FHA) protein
MFHLKNLKENPQLDLTLDSFPFKVGRNEPFFLKIKETVPHCIIDTQLLSREHARFDLKGGELCVTDLGSVNGTEVNGKKIKSGETIVLKEGNTVCFATKFCFIVHDKRVCQAGEQVLFLLPESTQSGLYPLGPITQFPFVIGREMPHFQLYGAAYQSELQAISKRHAEITRSGDILQITDLGSTNGTLLDGRALAEGIYPLPDKARLSFSPFFTYTVSWKTAAIEEITESNMDQSIAQDNTIVFNQGPGQQKSKKTQPEKTDGTVYMAEATDYLGIFSGQYKYDEDIEKVADEQRLKAPAKKINYLNSKNILLLTSVLLCLVAAGAGYIFTQDPRIKAFKLYKEANYAGAADIAGKLVKEQTEDSELQTLFINSVARSYLQQCVGALNEQKYQNFHNCLQNVSNLSHNDKQLIEIVETLSLVGRITQLLPFTNPQKIVVRIEDFVKYKEVYTQWDKNKLDYKSNLAKLAALENKYVTLQENFYQSLNMLALVTSRYIDAFDTLQKQMRIRLEEGRPEEIGMLMAKYTDDNPQVRGVQLYEEDLQQYLRLWESIKARNLYQVVLTMRSIHCQTEVFNTSIDRLKQDVIPDANTLAIFEMAVDSWKKGKAEPAISLLQSIKDGSWHKEINDELLHYQKIYSSYDQLMLQKGQEEFGANLHSFTKWLKSDDVYYLQQVQSELEKLKEDGARKMGQFFQAGENAWDQYLQNGKISGALRMENTLSEAFKKKAVLLNLASQNIQKGLEVSKTHQISLSPNQLRLKEIIITELLNERKRIIDLAGVLDENIKKDKIQFLDQSLSQAFLAGEL